MQRSFANGNQGHVLEFESSGRRRLTGVFTTEGTLGLAIDDVTEAGICVGSPALILLKHCGSWMAIEALQTQYGSADFHGGRCFGHGWSPHLCASARSEGSRVGSSTCRNPSRNICRSRDEAEVCQN